MQDLLKAQLAERRHNVQHQPLRDFSHYLDLREKSIGIHPFLTLAEHHYLQDNEAEYEDIHQLNTQITRLTVIQNDLGGLEKDLANGARSNAIAALGELNGQHARSREAAVTMRDMIRRAEFENDKLVAIIMRTWEGIMSGPLTEAKRQMSEAILTVSVTHLQWTLGSRRYTVEGVADVKSWS